MKLAIIFNDNRLSGILTWIWTGCYAYHCAWVDEAEGLMYDMHLLRRRRTWPHYSEGQIVFFDVPQVTRDYLERRLTEDDSRYGVVDYLLFVVRPIYHWVGKSTRNAGGEICSEMINDDMIANDIETPWLNVDAPPSPCDLYRWKMREGA